jgi:hypothetical protein
MPKRTLIYSDGLEFLFALRQRIPLAWGIVEADLRR